MTLDTIYNEHCLSTLSRMPDQSINSCITSPPYFGLRDYGHPEQIGLEETPEQFVAALVKVFREVKRVLREDGTLWLNLGDSYAGGGNGAANYPNSAGAKQLTNQGTVMSRARNGYTPNGLKPKDLIGIPWMVAFALRADGWYLRQDIIWHKPNPMPESVTDRCTKAHEYIFMLSRSRIYYYDAEAIKEPSVRSGEKSYHSASNPKYDAVPDERWKHQFNNRNWGDEGKANKRSVWTVATKPYSEAHFATFPETLIEPCVLASCPEGGVIYDPFMGAGTTALVAARAGRQYIGSELNPDYCKIAERRLMAHKNQLRLFA